MEPSSLDVLSGETVRETAGYKKKARRWAIKEEQENIERAVKKHWRLW